MKDNLPEWDDIAARHQLLEPLTSLEQFIFENEPANAQRFRMMLNRVIDDQQTELRSLVPQRELDRLIDVKDGRRLLLIWSNAPTSMSTRRWARFPGGFRAGRLWVQWTLAPKRPYRLDDEVDAMVAAAARRWAVMVSTACLLLLAVLIYLW